MLRDGMFRAVNQSGLPMTTLREINTDASHRHLHLGTIGLPPSLEKAFFSAY